VKVPSEDLYFVQEVLKPALGVSYNAEAVREVLVQLRTCFRLPQYVVEVLEAEMKAKRLNILGYVGVAPPPIRGPARQAPQREEDPGRRHRVRKRKVPKATVGDYLKVDEVPRVLEGLHPRWRPLFATAIYSGLRKGELGALQRKDVDFDARLVLVRRSWDRETTKGGHGDAVPIAAALVPWLREALENSPSELVFPHVCTLSCRRQRCPGPGGMLARDVALESVLRRALGRAGIARGWRHVCRRKGCGHVAPEPDAKPRRCPKCQMRLWPKPVVRPIRFHDLRHTTATLLLREKVPLVVVQKVLRHRDPKLTESVYGHLADDFLREGVDRLRFEGMPEPQPPAARAVVNWSGTPAGPKLRQAHEGPESRAENARTSGPFDLSGRRGSNPRPSAWEADALPLSYSRVPPW
jgi:integrase